MQIDNFTYFGLMALTVIYTILAGKFWQISCYFNHECECDHLRLTLAWMFFICAVRSGYQFGSYYYGNPYHGIVTTVLTLIAVMPFFRRVQ